MLRHMKNKEVLIDSERGLTKSKLCLANVWALYGGVTVLVDKEKAIDTIHLDLTQIILQFHTQLLYL